MFWSRNGGKKIEIGAYEKNPDKLIAVYMMGVQDAVQKLREIRSLLKNQEPQKEF